MQIHHKCTHVAFPRHPVPVAAEAVEVPHVFHGDGEVVDAEGMDTRVLLYLPRSTVRQRALTQIRVVSHTFPRSPGVDCYEEGEREEPQGEAAVRRCRRRTRRPRAVAVSPAPPARGNRTHVTYRLQNASNVKSF